MNKCILLSTSDILFLKGLIMILGMATSTFTFLHVLLSLVGIGSGFVVVFGLLTG